jgi:D-alanine-D-alanine ligase
LLFGGRSAEHEVSCVSAVAVYEALDPDRYEVVPVGITPEGRWLLASPDELQAGPTGELRHGLRPRGEPVALTGDPRAGGLLPLSSSGAVLATEAGLGAGTDVDVVFPLLHGPFGEDGTLQGLLEQAGIPYVGAGHTASALAMDKVLAKRTLRGAGIDVAQFVEVRESAWLRDPERVCLECSRLGFPCFVKPANLGSSVGVTKVNVPADLATALEEALTFDPVALVEEAILGRELEVGILGDDDPLATMPGEVVPSHEFYDFVDKYVEEGAKLYIPAPLDEAMASAASELALDAYRALGIEGMARVDLFLTPEGRLVVNEANTIPGFTPISMFPKLWAASGLSYSALCDRLIELAFARHERRKRVGRPRRLGL